MFGFFCLWAALIAGSPGRAGELYRTDFESYFDVGVEYDWVAGNDRWAGTDGWTANSVGVGAHGIDQDIIPGGGLGRTAFIGYNQPSTSFVYVRRPVAHGFQPGKLPMVEIETLLGIQDSVDKLARDSFFVSILDSSGSFLGGLRFCNENATFGLWREDGVNVNETGLGFNRGELHLLRMRIDLERNTWSAVFLEAGGVPLFEDQTFTATGLPVELGYVAFEWQLTAPTAAGYGDNWMMVADVSVRSAGRGVLPFRFSRFERSGSGSEMDWPGELGFDYQVEYSDDATTWNDNLSNSTFDGLTADQVLSYTDSSVAGRRFYRVVRSEAP